MIVLDTDVFSVLMRPVVDPTVSAWLAAREGEVFAITTITVAEIQFGIERLPQGRRRADLQRRFDASAIAYSVLPLDDHSARIAGAFRAQRERAGRSVASPDMMIAGIVAAHGASLATRNISDFEGLGLTLIAP